MTAAGRGNRIERDQYPTPAWCVERLCEAVPLPWPGALTAATWCEPGAGAGSIIKATNDFARRTGHVYPQWTAFEIDRTYRRPLAKLGAQVIIGDYLKARRLDSWVYAFDFGLGNCAYEITTKTVLRLRRICRSFCLLLPVTYNGSAGRCDMFQRDQPDLYLLPNRPCFVKVHTTMPNGKVRITTSDSSEYAWFLWPEKPQREGKIRVLNKTPPEVLRVAKEQAPIVYVDKRRGSA